MFVAVEDELGAAEEAEEGFVTPPNAGAGGVAVGVDADVVERPSSWRRGSCFSSASGLAVGDTPGRGDLVEEGDKDLVARPCADLGDAPRCRRD